MKHEHFQHVLNQFLTRRPWKPFTLELINGSWLVVEHPEFLAVYGTLLNWTNSNGARSIFEYTSVVRFIDGTGST